MSESIETLVTRATCGDGGALEEVVRRIKDDVYGLAMRMLCHPADAEDATQEILVRVIANLGTFEHRSRFRTWVYRVSVRALLNMKRGRAEAPLSFEAFAAELEMGLSGPPADLSDVELRVLKREVKIACTQAMLLCLDRDHRMAYLLGEILELGGDEAASCLDVAAATYRKRLSRARRRVNAFTAERCGLVSAAAPCRCDRRIAPAVAQGRVDPKRLLFANHAAADVSRDEAGAVVEAIGSICDGGALMRSNPRYQAPDRLLDVVRAVIDEAAGTAGAT